MDQKYSKHYFDKKYADVSQDIDDMINESPVDTEFLQNGPSQCSGLVQIATLYSKPDILQDCSDWCIVPKRFNHCLLDKELSPRQPAPSKKFKK